MTVIVPGEEPEPGILALEAVPAVALAELARLHAEVERLRARVRELEAEKAESERVG